MCLAKFQKRTFSETARPSEDGRDTEKGWSVIMEEGEIKVKSLQKALTILNCFVRKPRLGVTEISDMLDLNKSNVHNILTTFQAMNYLEQDAESGKYQLGLGILELCQSVGDRFNIRKVMMPYMQEIADVTGEVVYLAVPREDEMVYLEAMHPVESYNMMRVILGEHAKMYCTGIGKAVLAYLPEDVAETYIARGLYAFTKNTITDPEVLRRDLALTRERGYAVDNMEHEFGVKCVGMPVFSRRGELLAAVSVSGPSLRFSQERIEVIAGIMRASLKKVGERI